MKRYQRMHATSVAVLAGTLLAGLLMATGASAQGVPVAGKDYVQLATVQATENPGKVEVTEFFGYWCPHCNAFEPALNDWAKRQPADVVLRHVPMAFRDDQVPLQRLYYALDAMGKEGELRAKVFAAIHVDHNPLNTADLQADFAAKNGIDRQKYLSVYNSFSVEAKTRAATQMQEAYQIDSVPTLTVDGKYTAESTPQTLKTIDYLVGLERKQLGKHGG